MSRNRKQQIMERVYSILERSGGYDMKYDPNYNALEKEIGIEFSERMPRKNTQDGDTEPNYDMIKMGKSLNPAGLVKDLVNQAAAKKYEQRAKLHRIEQDVGIERKSPVSPIPFPERSGFRQKVGDNPRFFNPDATYDVYRTPEEQQKTSETLKQFRNMMKKGDRDIMFDTNRFIEIPDEKQTIIPRNIG